MVFDSKVTREEFYEMYVNTINGLIGLSPKEVQVFAKLMEVFNEISKKTDNVEIVSELLFSTKYRKIVMERIEGMTSLNFNNYIVSLKKKGVIIESDDINILNPNMVIKLKDNNLSYSIQFNFKIIEENEPEKTEQQDATESSEDDREVSITRDSNDEISQQELQRIIREEGLAGGSNGESLTNSEKTDLGLSS
jgi:hypothetical protein